MYINPFLRSHGDLAVNFFQVNFLHHVDVLYPKHIAAANNSTGIVKLINILNGNGKMAGALLHHLSEQLAPFWCQ